MTRSRLETIHIALLFTSFASVAAWLFEPPGASSCSHFAVRAVGVYKVCCRRFVALQATWRHEGGLPVTPTLLEVTFQLAPTACKTYEVDFDRLVHRRYCWRWIIAKRAPPVSWLNLRYTARRTYEVDVDRLVQTRDATLAQVLSYQARLRSGHPPSHPPIHPQTSLTGLQEGAECLS